MKTTKRERKRRQYKERQRIQKTTGFTAEQIRQMRRAMKAAMTCKPGLCFLCQIADAVIQGIFHPNKECAEQMGVPSNKLRIIGYGLCERCFALPDRQQRVEKKIMSSREVPVIDVGNEKPEYR